MSSRPRKSVIRSLLEASTHMPMSAVTRIVLNSPSGMRRATR